jgi:hypothetical protein
MDKVQKLLIVKSRIYKTVILPAVLYRCETWVLRRIFGPKRDGVTGGWRKLHNKELHNLYSSSSTIRIIKSRRMRWAGHVARKEEKRNMCMSLVGNPRGRRPLGRPRHGLVANIKMDLVEAGKVGVDWTGLAQDRDKWRAVVDVEMGNYQVATQMVAS